MTQWEGLERRSMCGSHEGLLNILKSMDGKMDSVLERQTDHAERLGNLEGIVTNGLSSNVKEIKARMELLGMDTDKRVTVLEDHDRGFKFFRDFVVTSRDMLFVNLLKLATVGGCIFLIWHFGDRILKQVLG